MKIAILHNNNNKSLVFAEKLRKIYNFYSIEDADTAIVLGGDGFMLQMQHKLMEKNIPLFGINFGNTGFLLNKHNSQNIFDRINKAKRYQFHPLYAHIFKNNKRITLYAINDFVLFRQTRYAIDISIDIINPKFQIKKEIRGDGLIISSSLGSTAYNLSAGGSILPVASTNFLLNPLNLIRHNWKGAILKKETKIKIKIININKKTTILQYDHEKIDDVEKLQIGIAKDIRFSLLFDKEASLEEKVAKAQFDLDHD